MVRIRLARLGKKNDPFYRIVAITQQRKNRGKALEILGTWYPKKNDLKIKEDRVKFWVDRGAQISDGVRKLIKQQ